MSLSGVSENNCLIYPDIQFTLILKSFCPLNVKRCILKYLDSLIPSHTHTKKLNSSISIIPLPLLCLSSITQLKACIRLHISEYSNGCYPRHVTLHLLITIVDFSYSVAFSIPSGNILSIEQQRDVPFCKSHNKRELLNSSRVH